MVDSSSVEKSPLPLSPSAASVHDAIVGKLNALLAGTFNSCLDATFKSRFSEVLELFARFQHEVLLAHPRAKSCVSGCFNCCYHWVEDVNSFEAEMIAAYIRTHFPGRIKKIIHECSRDIEQMQRIERVTAEKLLAENDPGKHDIDEETLLLSSFYLLRRPCPLLTNDGRCSVYPVRPITCRAYISLSDPWRCDPDYINEEDIPTYLLDFEEDANMLLDKMHLKFLRYEGDTGLRSVLVRYLQEK